MQFYEQKKSLFWFRRDLRLHDNTALEEAKKKFLPIVPVFIFDFHILSKIASGRDARVSFLFRRVHQLDHILREKYHSQLCILYGKPEDIFPKLIKILNIAQVFCNHDYEPLTCERDKKIQTICEEKQIQFFSCKDHVIFEKDEILTQVGTPYKIYTSYAKAWKKQYYTSFSLDRLNFNKYSNKEREEEQERIFWKPENNFGKKIGENKIIFSPTLQDMGFQDTKIYLPASHLKWSICIANLLPKKKLINYQNFRDFPGYDATSHIGILLRFGCVSIREVVGWVHNISEIFLNELIWREFFSQILWNFPYVFTKNFVRHYDTLEWRNQQDEFERWKAGKTGYPLVDAGMRQLMQTGIMHNRVRMVAASFLVKHLLIDWRWGEKHFANHLLDFELASNNGNWQWVAGCGCDAAPYFRIFHPEAQHKKFDPNNVYIKKWITEYNPNTYISPMIDHKIARTRCLEVYKKARNNFL